MRFLRATPALILLLICNGCGYVHFGRMPETVTPVGDAALSTAYSNLSTEHKVLQQELILARKEGDALRTALEQRGEAGSADLSARLKETTRELATLRESYAKLQAESKGSSGGANAALRAQLASTEEKLAASLHDFTQLQEENTRLRSELNRARMENSTLADQLKTSVANNDQAKVALAELNSELLAQKEARTHAEQQTSAVRAQLATVIATSNSNLAAARDTAATSVGALAPQTNAPAPAAAGSGGTADAPKAGVTLAQAPAPATPPTAELRTSATRINLASQLTLRDGKRIYVVRAGDTLESIATKFYGTSTRWSRLFTANIAQLSDDRPIKPGMELEVPEE